MIKVTLTDITPDLLRSLPRKLTEEEVHSLEEEHDRERGPLEPHIHPTQYGAAAH